LIDWLVGLRFYIPLDTKQVILETLLAANLMAGIEKAKSKPGETSTNIST